MCRRYQGRAVAVLATGLMVAYGLAVPSSLQAQRQGGPGSRGPNFARGLMESGRGGGRPGRGPAGRGPAAAGGNRPSRGIGGPGGRGPRPDGPGVQPRVDRGDGRGGGRGDYRRDYRRNRSSFGIGVGVYGPTLGWYYGTGRYGLYPGYGYGVPYWGSYPGYQRYGYGYRGALPYSVPRYEGRPNYSYGRPGYDGSQTIVVPDQQSAGGVVPTRAPQPIIECAEAAAPYQAQAESAFHDNEIDQAVRLVRHAVIEDPQNGKLRLFAAQTLFAAGRYAEAVEALRNAISLLDQDEWGYVVDHYKQFYHGKNYVRQMDELVDWMQQNPNDPNGPILRGYQYRYLGYEQPAQKQLTNALALAPDDELPAMLLGTIDRPLAEQPEELPAGDPISEATLDSQPDSQTGDDDSEIEPTDSDAADALESGAAETENADSDSRPGRNAAAQDDSASGTDGTDSTERTDPPSQSPPPVPTPDS